jgi:hypothetical protein
MASKIVSVELDTETLDQLTARGRETGEDVARLAQRLIEEGIRMERHPGIVFRDGPVGRRPSLLRGPDVWEVIPAVLNPKNPTADAIAIAAENTGITDTQVRVALKYYDEYTDEIDFWIERNKRLGEELRARMQRDRASA